MLFLVRLLTLVLLIFAAQAKAGTIDVNTLNQDSCWVQEMNPGMYRIASFNNSLATELNSNHAQELYDLVLEKFEQLGVGQFVNQQSMLFCSAFGASLVMNLQMENAYVCAWGAISADGIKLMSVGLSEKEDFCHGYKPGEVLIQVTDINQARMTLASSEWNTIVTRYESVTENVLKLYLHSDYQLDVEKIVKDLNGGENSSWLKSADLNYYNHSIGELMFLKF